MRRIVILTWVSGSWKTSLQEELILRGWSTPINFTTRKPRNNKELDYYVFLTEKQFQIKKKHWDFLETTNYNWNNYWISKFIWDWNIVLILDVNWREEVINKFRDNNIKFKSYYINLTPELQKERLLKRWDNKEQIKKRSNDFDLFYPTDNCEILDWSLDTKILADYIITNE